MKIKLQVFGTGCPKCKQLAAVAEEAAKELNLEYELEKVTDINKIVESGVMRTPALSIDGEVKVNDISFSGIRQFDLNERTVFETEIAVLAWTVI